MSEQTKTEQEILAEKIDLLNADLLKRAAELKAEHNGAEIEPLLFLDPKDPTNGQPIVGFLKEPNRATKAAIGDEILKSHFRGNMVALESCLMKDISDKRLTSTDRAYDAVIFAAGEKAAAFVRISIDLIKKK